MLQSDDFIYSVFVGPKGPPSPWRLGGSQGHAEAKQYDGPHHLKGKACVFLKLNLSQQNTNI